VLPFGAFIMLNAHSLLQALVLFVVFILVLVLYFIVIWVVLMVMEFLFSLIGYPIIRRLSRGVVPPPSALGKPQSKLQDATKRVARRLGFLPR
jgi:hypothetical protein